MGGQIFFSNGESNSRGVATLINRCANVRVIRKYHDTEGRCNIIEFKEQDYMITLCNIYAPNKDCPHFFESLSKTLEGFSENKIIMGDFNVVLDENLDRYNSNRNKNTPIRKAATRHALENILEEYCLADVWRIRNNDKKEFSWSKRCPGLCASRIDYAIVSRGFCDK